MLMKMVVHGIKRCHNVSRKGHFECLKYAHENGCPWDEWTCRQAFQNKHLDCLKYCIVNNCECGFMYDIYLDKIL